MRDVFADREWWRGLAERQAEALAVARAASTLLDDAAVLAALRASGLSQRAIAERTGFSRAYVCDVMHGRRAIPARVAALVGARRVEGWAPASDGC